MKKCRRVYKNLRLPILDFVLGPKNFLLDFSSTVLRSSCHRTKIVFVYEVDLRRVFIDVQNKYFFRYGERGKNTLMLFPSASSDAPNLIRKTFLPHWALIRYLNTSIPPMFAHGEIIVRMTFKFNMESTTTG